ncbi:MAG: radical SAM protein [Candidatus Methanoperedens sp.]|nr:radical SAM protein [Candidatus Methanoperedens sp.]MCE8427924.1 radical SAM protein [Candidatus Methanoperedens sp.]
MNAEIKAELISIGAIDIDPKYLGRLTIPTAGPGAGGKAFFFRSGKHRVRLVVDEGSPLRGVKENNDIVIMKGGKELVRGNIEEELIHCPEQAYITMSERCIYDCKFCPVPKLKGKVKSSEELIALVEKANSFGKMKGISITSGIEVSPEKEVERAAKLVRALRKYNVPIGVSVYPTKDSSRILKEAGASEVKYNVETMDRVLYEKYCKKPPLDFTLECLKDAVKIFGNNHVFTNFIVGLGETDDTIKKYYEELAKMGVIPVLRAVGVHPLRFGELEAERPTGERILKLTKMARRMLDIYGLDASVAKTMCLPCMGCDLNPHVDL